MQSSDDSTDVVGFKRLSPGNKFFIAVFYMTAIATFAYTVTVLVLVSKDFNYGNEVDNKQNELEKVVRDAGIIESPCMTCDTKTGDITFNSTIDIASPNDYPHFVESTDSDLRTGLTVPGYAFVNSPLSPKSGAPTFLGDMFAAVGSGIDQSDDGLPRATAPAGAKINQKPPNPSAFLHQPNRYFLGIGMFQGTSTSVTRCSPSQMTASPAVYIVVDDSATPFTYHLCICVTNDPSEGTGAGEKCTTADFVTGAFP